jgi:hypothetical protein
MNATSNSSNTASNGSAGTIVRGRPFAQGNPGRPAGSRNRSTVVTQSLLDGDAPALLRKGLEVAKAGDPTMLKFFLERLVPRDRKVTVELPPLETAEDAVEAIAVVAKAVAEGQLTPAEGANVTKLVEAFSRSIDVVELTRRVEALEAEVRHAPK